MAPEETTLQFRGRNVESPSAHFGRRIIANPRLRNSHDCSFKHTGSDEGNQFKFGGLRTSHLTVSNPGPQCDDSGTGHPSPRTSCLKFPTSCASRERQSVFQLSGRMSLCAANMPGIVITNGKLSITTIRRRSTDPHNSSRRISVRPVGPRTSDCLLIVCGVSPGMHRLQRTKDYFEKGLLLRVGVKWTSTVRMVSEF